MGWTARDLNETTFFDFAHMSRGFAGAKGENKPKPPSADDYQAQKDRVAAILASQA